MVLDMHGGSIELERCDGQGSSFVVRLPIAASGAGAAPSPAATKPVDAARQAAGT
jgi:hypothetical protein